MTCNQVKRKRGDPLQATGKHGKVLPELLVEQVRGGAGDHWPEAASTTRVRWLVR